MWLFSQTFLLFSLKSGKSKHFIGFGSSGFLTSSALSSSSERQSRTAGAGTLIGGAATIGICDGGGGIEGPDRGGVDIELDTVISVSISGCRSGISGCRSGICDVIGSKTWSIVITAR